MIPKKYQFLLGECAHCEKQTIWSVNECHSDRRVLPKTIPLCHNCISTRIRTMFETDFDKVEPLYDDIDEWFKVGEKISVHLNGIQPVDLVIHYTSASSYASNFTFIAYTVLDGTYHVEWFTDDLTPGVFTRLLNAFDKFADQVLSEIENAANVKPST